MSHFDKFFAGIQDKVFPLEPHTPSADNNAKIIVERNGVRLNLRNQDVQNNIKKQIADFAKISVGDK